jgi:hypothetical protein
MLEILVTMIMNERIYVFTKLIKSLLKMPFQPTKFPLHILSKRFSSKKQKCFMMLKDFSNSKIISISLQKNRSKGFDGTAFLYKIPIHLVFTSAVLMGEFKTCDNDNHCAITAATIAPDDSKVAILTHDRFS